MTTLNQYPMVRPRPGLVFEAYMSRKDIGSGVRMFIVLKCGRKYVHLFYPPQLYTFTVHNREWATMHKAPVLAFDQTLFKKRLGERARSFDHLGVKYPHEPVARMQKLNLVHGARLFGRPHNGKTNQ